MPARQDQTLQIFLIVFIFLFLVSAVVAYLGWKGYGEQEQRAVGLETQLKDKSDQANKLQVDNEQSRTMMGFGANDDSAAVKDAFDKDMKAFGPGIADGTYRKVLEAVFAELSATAARESKLKDDIKARENELAASDAKYSAQIASFQKASNDAKQDAANLKNAFDQDRGKLEDTKVALQKNLDEQRTTYEKQITDLNTNVTKSGERIEKLAHANTILKDQRKDEPGSFEIADGRVSSVNQGDRTVWIDLGSADSLRRQVTFSVFDGDSRDAAKAQKKGSIEVTRVIGDHLAEAKITEDAATNPIIAGDQIYSQVWHRGKKLRFALTGIIDFDEDGRSDATLARELIEYNGGSVDAYVKEDGTVEGEITPNTRYLVLGEFPTGGREGAQAEAWSAMNKEGSEMGVETITLNEFLAQMGYKPQDRTVQLGAGATARDFPARGSGAPTPVAPRQRFRMRTPTRTHSPAVPQAPRTLTQPNAENNDAAEDASSGGTPTSPGTADSSAGPANNGAAPAGTVPADAGEPADAGAAPGDAGAAPADDGAELLEDTF